MELYFVILWLIAAVYFIWRLRVVSRRRDMMSQEISSMVFLLGLGVLGLISLLLPDDLPRAVGIAVVAVLVIVCAVISYKINKKYEEWREAQLEEEM